MPVSPILTKKNQLSPMVDLLPERERGSRGWRSPQGNTWSFHGQISGVYSDRYMSVCIYIYIMYTYIHTYIYIYIHKSPER